MKTLMIGNIVKFGDTFTRVTDYIAIDYQVCAVLATKKGLTGAVPAHRIKWTGLQWVVMPGD